MSKYSEDDYLTRKERKFEKKIASKKDRSKFKKTDFAKREKQLKEETEKKLQKKDLARGRVLAISPEGISVESAGLVHLCTLRGLLKKEVRYVKNLITIGDFVLFEPEEKSIAFVEARYSVLSRKEHLRQKKEQLIAANIDQVIIVASVLEPPLKPSLIDRYLIATYKGNMSPLVVINKTDLLEVGSDSRALFETVMSELKKLKIPVLALSVVTGEGIEALKMAMKDKASVFSGQSGVGKSSLINVIAKWNLPIGEIVKKTQKGAHTTTTAHLIPLEFGGFCIDTPGIRSFGVWDLQKEDLDVYFSEIKEKARECRYPNCTHTHEPDCAVQKSVLNQEISLLRYQSYLKLLEEILTL